VIRQPLTPQPHAGEKVMTYAPHTGSNSPVREIKSALFTLWALLNSLGLTKGTLVRLSRRNRLTAQQRHLLQTMRDDNSAAPAPFRATARWRYLADRFDASFRWTGLDNPETSDLNRFLSGVPPGDMRLLRHACWLLYQNLKARDRFDVFSRIESAVPTGTGLSLDFDGRRIPWDLLISVDTLYGRNSVD